ncbi:DUF3263 domain-containing protein [Streptomyces sp. NPDC002067]
MVTRGEDGTGSGADGGTEVTGPPGGSPAPASPEGGTASATEGDTATSASPEGGPASAPEGGPASASPEGGPASAAEDGATAPGPGELSALDVAVLAVERRSWPSSGPKERYIREHLGLSPTHYYQLLNALLDDPRARRHDPVTVNRLLRIREAKRGRR